MTDFERPHGQNPEPTWQQSGQVPPQSGQNWANSTGPQQIPPPVPMHHGQYSGGIPPTDKSVGVAVLLTFLFGCFGLFYSSVVGGLVMTAISLLVGLLSVLTLGIGGVLFFLVWPATMIWGGLSASSRHRAFVAWYAQRSGRPYGG